MKQAKLYFTILLGILIGLSFYTFYYGRGHSYLSKSPEACINCHIMKPQYASWMKSNHRHVAGCNQCHLPNTGIKKWIAKMENGFLHSFAFTFENFHEPIFIRDSNKDILEENCAACHQQIHEDTLIGKNSDQVKCLRCHTSIGHGPRTSMGRFEGISPAPHQLRKENS